MMLIERFSVILRWLASYGKLCVFLVLVLVSAACEKQEPATVAPFCQAVSNIETVLSSVDKRNQVQGHAQVLASLLPVAPQPIRAQLEELHDLFDRWSRAGDSVLGTVLLFKELSDPALAGLEGEIADYMISNCGMSLPAGISRVVPDENSEPICPAWPRRGSPLSNNRFPNYLDTSGGNYFANQFWSMPVLPAPPGFIDVPRGGSVVFKGQYPKARYFAFHPNDKSTNNLKTLVDVEIEPDAGSINPYREPVTEDHDTRFTVRYVFSEEPAQPAANTRYVGRSKTGGYNPVVMNLIRIYASDLGSNANSGGVKLPSVTVFDAQGEQIAYYPECDPYPNGPETEFVETSLFPVMPVPDHRAENPVHWDTYSQFNLPVDILANADVQYINGVLSQRFGELYVIRAKGLSAPDTRAGEPVFAEGKDVRFWTVCNYNFWAGRAGTCLLDSEVPLDDQGFYTLVVAPEKYRPVNLGQRQDIWLDWGGYLDTQISYRTGLRNNPKLKQLSKAINGEGVGDQISPYVPVAVPCSKTVYEQGGWQACWQQQGMLPQG